MSSAFLFWRWLWLMSMIDQKIRNHHQHTHTRASLSKASAAYSPSRRHLVDTCKCNTCSLSLSFGSDWCSTDREQKKRYAASTCFIECIELLHSVDARITSTQTWNRARISFSHLRGRLENPISSANIDKATKGVGIQSIRFSSKRKHLVVQAITRKRS